MERATWTDERLDDLSESIRTGFARADQDIRDLRADTRSEFAALRAEIDALRLTVLRVGGAGFLGIIAAILARGV